VAVDAGCDGVEINAGQHSLVRQFLSGLTNQRDDPWGHDRLMFARQVIAAVRDAVGTSLVGLRLSCDELAPWAGITPDMAVELAAVLREHVDHLVVVRGSIFSAEKTRPDFHEPANFNVDLCRRVRAAVPGLPVFLLGSVVDPSAAESALRDDVCDGVEMTRAQIADPDLFAKLRDGRGGDVRPCIRCNQTCQVRDARNPVVTCVVEPSAGRETEDPNWYAADPRPRDVLVVGGGVAGLETARVAALRGHRVRLVEHTDQLGGTAALLDHAAPFVEWLAEQCRSAGVSVELCADQSAATADDTLVQCTGGRPGTRSYTVEPGATVVDAVDAWQALVRGHGHLPAGPIALFDPIGGPIAVRLAEQLG
ncbi:MAG: FAD-dependent oxidoreductase, partial [Actinomycetota bacterium]|nr:FAD-dependent oxidoreductase [Actinomycetota bacterium]